jgi:hypothetical protein
MRLLVLSLLLLGAAASANPGRATPPAAEIPGGSWGGEHVALVASESGASLQFDCAHGAIAGRLSLGTDGRFDLAGDFASEHGGPIRKNEVEERRPARYRGRVEGKRMTLVVEIAGESSLGPFSLELGNPGRIVRCR